VIRIEDLKEQVCSLQFWAGPIRLPGRKEKMFLVVVVGFGQEPLMLLTNLVALVAAAAYFAGHLLGTKDEAAITGGEVPDYLAAVF
jgi:hypothetical protein